MDGHTASGGKHAHWKGQLTKPCDPPVGPLIPRFRSAGPVYIPGELISLARVTVPALPLQEMAAFVCEGYVLKRLGGEKPPPLLLSDARHTFPSLCER